MNVDRRRVITSIFGAVGAVVLNGCVESATKNSASPSSPAPSAHPPMTPLCVLDVLTADGHTIEFGSMFLNGRPLSFVIAVDGEAQDAANNMFWIFQVDGVDILVPPHQCMVPVGGQVTAMLVRREREIVAANT